MKICYSGVDCESSLSHLFQAIKTIGEYRYELVLSLSHLVQTVETMRGYMHELIVSLSHLVQDTETIGVDTYVLIEV